MSDETSDLIAQFMGDGVPSSVDEMRSMLDQLGSFLNVDLPEVGAFHEAVPVCEGVTADVVVPKGGGLTRFWSTSMAGAGSVAVRFPTGSWGTGLRRRVSWS